MPILRQFAGDKTAEVLKKFRLGPLDLFDLTKLKIDAIEINRNEKI